MVSSKETDGIIYVVLRRQKSARKEGEEVVLRLRYFCPRDNIRGSSYLGIHVVPSYV